MSAPTAGLAVPTAVASAVREKWHFLRCGQRAVRRARGCECRGAAAGPCRRAGFVRAGKRFAPVRARRFILRRSCPEGGRGVGVSLPPVPRISRPPLKLWGLVGSNSRGADSRHIVAGVNLCCVRGRFSLRVVLVPDRAVVSGRGRAGRH